MIRAFYPTQKLGENGHLNCPPLGKNTARHSPPARSTRTASGGKYLAEFSPQSGVNAGRKAVLAS